MLVFDDHPPFQRITSGEETAVDRQWVRFLADAFSNVGHGDLVLAGFDSRFATEILGVVALHHRMSANRPSEDGSIL